MKKDPFIRKIERDTLIFGWLKIACYAMLLTLLTLIVIELLK